MTKTNKVLINTDNHTKEDIPEEKIDVNYESETTAKEALIKITKIVEKGMKLFMI
jgi:hypothetical protein